MKLYIFILLTCAIFLTPRLQAQELDSIINIFPNQELDKKQASLKEIIRITYLNNPDTAIYYANKLNKVSSQLEDSLGVAHADFLLGVCFYLKSNYKQAAYHYKKSYKIYLEANNKEGISYCLNNLGIVYQIKGDLKTALEYYLKSLKIDEEFAPPSSIADSYTNIGILLLKLGDIKKAKKYQTKAYNIYKNTDDYMKIGLSLMNLHEVYYNEENYDSARYFIDKSINTYKQHNIKQNLQKALIHKATLLEDNKQLDSAYYYYKESLEVSKEIKNDVSIAVALIHISSIETKRGNNEKAIKLAKEGLSSLKDAGSISVLADAHKIISDAYYKTGDIDKAYLHLTDYIRYEDSASAIDTKSTIAELEYKYETNKIEEENQFLKTENELKENLIQAQKNRQWIIIITLGVLSVFVFFLYRTTRKLQKANSKLSNSNEEIEKQRKQLENLNHTKDKMFSIIGHDLRGPIGNIKSFMDLILQNTDYYSKESILEILLSIRDSSNNTLLTLENLLAWSQTQQGALEVDKTKMDLKDVVRKALELVDSKAKNKNISLNKIIPDNCMVYADEEMLNVIIRNILSNALKFTKESGSVTIEAKDYNDDKVLISIKDTGVGMDKKNAELLFKSEKFDSKYGTQNEKGNGIGLHLCKEFIKEHEEDIWVESEKGAGTTFYFTVSKP